MKRFYTSSLEKIGGNGSKAYRCVACGGLIVFSDQFLVVEGRTRHVFTNPAGVECDFYTLSSCQGAVAAGEAIEADTWFSGYTWRFAFCSYCGQHLGWYYESISELRRPLAFWGILVSQLIKATEHPLGGI